MKRKRFIKLLMAQGYQRNRAAQIAHEARAAYGKSYRDIWRNPIFRLGIVLTPGVCKALAAIGNASIETAKIMRTIAMMQKEGRNEIRFGNDQ